MDASADQMNAILSLCGQFAEMRGHKVSEVLEAVLTTKTLKAMGHEYGLDAHLTAKQADAAMEILARWVEKARELS